MPTLTSTLDPFQPGNKQAKLNRSERILLYRKYKQQTSFVSLAKEFNISPARVAKLIVRIESNMSLIKRRKKDYYDALRVLEKNNNAFDKVSITALDLPYVLLRPLWRSDVNTIQDLIDLGSDRLICTYGIGPKAFIEINKALKKMGIRLS